MTTDSLQLHGNLVAGMDHPVLANFITQKAASLDVEGRSAPFHQQTFGVGGQNIEMWFLPENKDALLA